MQYKDWICNLGEIRHSLHDNDKTHSAVIKVTADLEDREVNSQSLLPNYFLNFDCLSTLYKFCGKSK